MAAGWMARNTTHSQPINNLLFPTILSGTALPNSTMKNHSIRYLPSGSIISCGTEGDYTYIAQLISMFGYVWQDNQKDVECDSRFHKKTADLSFGFCLGTDKTVEHVAVTDNLRARGNVYSAHLFYVPNMGFQDKVMWWCNGTFRPEVWEDKQERARRFCEESLELCQAAGMSKEEVQKHIEWVFNRPVGELPQEVGGTMVTLAALCGVAGIDMEAAAKEEYERINIPEVRNRISAKQATRDIIGTPLEVTTPVAEDLLANLNDKNYSRTEIIDAMRAELTDFCGDLNTNWPETDEEDNAGTNGYTIMGILHAALERIQLQKK